MVAGGARDIHLILCRLALDLRSRAPEAYLNGSEPQAEDIATIH